jgi:hypothetical protein
VFPCAVIHRDKRQIDEFDMCDLAAAVDVFAAPEPEVPSYRDVSLGRPTASKAAARMTYSPVHNLLRHVI